MNRVIRHHYFFLFILLLTPSISGCQWFANRYFEDLRTCEELYQIHNDLDYDVSIITNIDKWGQSISFGDDKRTLLLNSGSTIDFTMISLLLSASPLEGNITIGFNSNTTPNVTILDNSNSPIYYAEQNSGLHETGPNFFNISLWERIPQATYDMYDVIYLLSLSSIILE